jgi:hypothetical protein
MVVNVAACEPPSAVRGHRSAHLSRTVLPEGACGRYLSVIIHLIDVSPSLGGVEPWFRELGMPTRIRFSQTAGQTPEPYNFEG